MTLKLVDNQRCFACGSQNPHGLKLKFRRIGEREMQSEFTPTETFQGFKDIMHGGIMALLLDEIMINLAWVEGLRAVTSEFHMRLERPARIGEKIILKAHIEKVRMRLVLVKSRAYSANHGLLAEAEAKCVKI